MKGRLPAGISGVDVDRPPEDLPQGIGLSVLRGHMDGRTARGVNRVQLTKESK